MTENNCSESYEDYLSRAAHACEAGDSVLGMHLYLAAYEKAVADPEIADGTALSGLREAWNLACDLKERSMAEYVFEKLEPYLTGDEIADCANELQNLALDRLAEYGFSREELQGMAEMISQDFAEDGAVVKVESISIPRMSGLDPQASTVDAAVSEHAPEDAPAPAEPGERERAKELGMGTAPADFNPYDYYDTSSVGKSYHAATNDGTDAYVFTRDKDRAAESDKARAERRKSESTREEGAAVSASEPESARAARADDLAAEPASDAEGRSQQPEAALAPASEAAGETNLATPAPAPREPVRAPRSEQPSMPDVPKTPSAALNYRTLAGYADTISVMRDFGVGLHRDPGFKNFVAMMNARHGLARMPALDTLLFRSPVVEDAARFVDATVGEIGLPMLRMSMEEGPQGMPVLCVATQGDNRPRMNHSHNRFDGPGILVIDDLDVWSMPQPPEGVEGIAGFVMANMSRGAREAVNLIRSAVEDPDVYVLVTATTQGDPDPFFYELLEPITIVDIPYPTEAERADIWNEIMNDHPSMRKLDRADMLRYSAGLPRYDIYMAARAAIEDAYKEGLVKRMFLPVSNESMLDKLAACHAVDTDEYRAIEDAAVASFRASLDDLSDLLGEAAE